MADLQYLCLSIAVMAVVTYLIRMLPMAVFRKKIKSKFALNFLFYVPYAVLSAMTIPAIFYSSGSIISALVGCAAAIVLALLEKGLLTVAVCACAGVFATEMVMRLMGAM